MKVSVAVILFFFYIFHALAGFSQNASYLIHADQQYINCDDPVFENIKPGDTLLFENGNRDFFIIKNFHGSPEKPIIITNSGGVVTIDTDHYFGISIQNCRYIKITGTGALDSEYGFMIERVDKGSGMGIGYLSSDFEIDHFSIKNCFTAGIYAKTDPGCTFTSVRDSFVQYNTIIHDNYIENAGLEGMYIGSSKYSGQTISCNGKDTLLLPHVLEGVRIYNNTIISSGWDGIQVSSASKDCKIFNNIILYDSQFETSSQMSGILIGGGTKCDCFNNYIANGKGEGIEIHGLGGIRVFSNIILNAGKTFKPDDLSQLKHGIFVTDVSAQADSSFIIIHNNIINPKSDGIRFSSIKSKNNRIESNVIVNPGNFDYYEDGNTSFKGIDSYMMFQFAGTDVIMKNNFLDRTVENAGFISSELSNPADFGLLENSPLIDAADFDNLVRFDFFGVERPQGFSSDIGAVEFESHLNFTENIMNKKSAYFLYENPVIEILKIGSESHIMGQINITLYDLTGTAVKVNTIPNINIFNQTIQLNISNLISGLYVYKIHENGNTFSGKFIKQ